MGASTWAAICVGIIIIDVLTIAAIWKQVPASARPIVMVMEGLFVVLMVVFLFFPPIPLTGP
ncbi:MAG TPA: hypothetical protein VEI97_15490 [bacterium]|nr:hypothetical protein [bacterium]